MTAEHWCSHPWEAQEVLLRREDPPRLLTNCRVCGSDNERPLTPDPDREAS
jgi:hypothetical protein